MDILKELFHQIPPKDLQELEFFIQKYKNKSERKDLELIKLLQSKNELKPKDYTQKLYGSHKLNNYQAIRKRLLKQLSVFITQKHMLEDQTSTSLLAGYLSIIRYMINNNHEFLAWTFMKKAETLAIKNAHYDLLNTVYNYQIEHAASQYATPLKSIIKNKLKYRKLAEEEEKYSMVYALITQKLNEIKHSNINLNIDETIKKLLKQNNLETEITKNPKTVFQLVKITRSSNIANKDFFNLHQYIQKQYNYLLNNSSFNKTNHIYKLEILYMLCHALYRSRKFESCLEEINHLENELDKFNGIYKKRFATKTDLLKSVVFAYSQQLEEAINSTEKLLTTKIEETDRLRALLNLGFFYFTNNNLKKASQINLRIGHTNRWCEKKMGKEWLMKKSLMEIIIQYELENYDLVLKRINHFRQNFKSLMEHPIFSRLKIYIEVIRKLIANPNILDSEEYLQKVQESLTSIPEEKEDLQAMAFYSWLKSKIQKTSYQEALINTLK